MKLEVGMYIRSPKGIIEKIDYLIKQDNPFWPYTINCTPRMSGDIAKASHNIIDLIEVGDYVNGSLVSDITGEYLRIDGESHNKHYFSKEIKTILTHEQFEREAYKV